MLKNSKALRRLGAGVATVTIAGILPVVAASSAFANVLNQAVTFSNSQPTSGMSNTPAGSGSTATLTFTTTLGLSGTASPPDSITVAFPNDSKLPTTASSYTLNGGPFTGTVTGPGGAPIPSGSTTNTVTLVLPASGSQSTVNAGTQTLVINGFVAPTAVSGNQSGNVSTSRESGNRFTFTTTGTTSAPNSTVVAVNPSRVPASTSGIPVQILGSGFTASTVVTFTGNATGATVSFTPGQSGATFVSANEIDVVTGTTPPTTGTTGTSGNQFPADTYSVAAGGSSLPNALAAVANLSLVPTTPTRILANQSISPNSPFTLSVAPSVVVPQSATSVVLNVTETGGTVGNLRVYNADRSTAPNISTVNYQPGADVANSVVVPLSQAFNNAGRVTLQSFGSGANVFVDVTGYFFPTNGTPANNNSFDTTTTPAQRVFDSRFTGAPLAANGKQTITLPAGPANGLPVLNVTAIAPRGVGNLRVGTSTTTAPDTSTVNFIPGVDKANLTIQSGTSVTVYDFGSATDFAVDFLGYVVPAAGGNTPVAIANNRVVDTRFSSSGPLTPGNPQSFSGAGTNGFFANVTSIGPNGVGNIRAYPQTGTTVANTPTPGASTVNLIRGADVANFALIAVSPSPNNNNFILQTFGSTVNAAVDELGTF